MEIDVKKLLAENDRMKAEIQNMEWASRKTNEGIRTLYKDLERKNAELKTLDQMKSRFLAAVSHELRTPITIMTQAAENILAGIFGPLTDKQRLWVERIGGNADRLARLVNDILDLSRLQSGAAAWKMTDVDMAQALRSTVDNMSALAEKKDVRLSLRLSAPPAVWGVMGRIEQVLMNLIGNALKFTPPGGCVDVSGIAESGNCRIEVSDTGPGIAPDGLSKIFDAFVQLNQDDDRHDSHGGVGLGLAICKEIVERHGGEIWAESDGKSGSRFVFLLPIRDAKGEIKHA